MNRPEAARELEPGMRGVWLGVIVYRWVSFVWMTVLAFATRDDLRRPGPAFAMIAALAVWNVWFTLTQAWERPGVRLADLGISCALLPFSGWVMQEGTAGGSAPFFATSYPASSALTVGVGEGLGGGLVAGAVLSVALVLSRPFNGIPLTTLTTGQVAALMNGIVYYVAAGGAAGVVSRAIRRLSTEREEAVELATHERERAARLAEREALGRKIHDSVLQSLTLIEKRGRELVATGSPAPADRVEELVNLATHQERELRALLSEPQDTPPDGSTSLRTALRAEAYATHGIAVAVAMTGQVWLPATQVEGLAAAVRQALDNVVMHAGASKITIFADVHDGAVEVSIRDDGVGFVYDEARLLREGRIGLLRSMKGRVEDIGGTMLVHTSPGNGTEVEFRMPTSADGRDG